MKRSSDQSPPAAKRSKGDIPEANDDYETGLTKLWGEDTLTQLRRYVRDADIEDHHIRNLLYDEEVLEIETHFLKELLSQTNADYSTLKTENESSASPCEDQDHVLVESLQSSRESFVTGKQLYRDIVQG